MRVVIAAVVLAGLPGVTTPANGLHTDCIEKLTGAKGTADAKEGVSKVSVPRADLAVSAAGVRITAPVGPHVLGRVQAGG